MSLTTTLTAKPVFNNVGKEPQIIEILSQNGKNNNRINIVIIVDDHVPDFMISCFNTGDAASKSTI